VLPIGYSLTVDGSPAPGDVMGALQEIAVEDHAELATVMRLRLATAVKEGGGGWTVIDDALFPRLAKVGLSVTVGTGSATKLFDGYVAHTTARFSNDPGESTYTVVAMDATVLMNLEEKIRAWPDMADSDIASSIFGDHGLTPQVEATQPSREATSVTTIQRGTDIRFLRRLAARNGYECFVSIDPASGAAEGHFHPPRVDATPQATLSVNFQTATTVNALVAKHDMLRPAHAKVMTIDPSDASSQQAEIDSAALQTLGAESTVASDKPRKLLLTDTGLAQSGELQSLAQGVVDRSAFALSAEGDLTTGVFGKVLFAKKPVLVRGVGTRLSGEWYVERVLHDLRGAEYDQHFTLRRNALGMTSSESFTDDRAGVA
jgi:phage protein D